MNVYITVHIPFIEGVMNSSTAVLDELALLQKAMPTYVSHVLSSSSSHFSIKIEGSTHSRTNFISPFARVPPNVRFEIDDVEADWTYKQKFDYIHCRFMGNAIQNWPRLISQCFQCVFPISVSNDGTC